MRSDRLRRLAAAVAAATLPVAGATVLPAPAASAQPCSDVEVIFARGTSEPPGIGRVGQALTDALTPQLGGRSVSTYAVNYPASYDFLTTAAGATDAAGRIASLAAQCPNTRIVLGGYSQGAAVVDMLAGVPPLGNKIGEIGSAPPLASGLIGNVDAVAVFGNPAAKFGNPVSGDGMFAGKAIDLCADGDPICSDGRNPFAHTHYETSPFIGQAAGFAAARV
ncbi:cutinase family protein [Mycolicibacterium sp. 018/SC-01/001]|uniref:cutinase family protein n=1 Tax=Mycolicibacterium sp. 018/SC-01/001 TaxID=2592069 RepID=UPI00117D168E|nr:cutinase family protein [Mycolicibacterium sp. 018/SC-01/001]TRW81685.1 cutinase family protein [Mycolicibacterium sp. 018/SC-01/001]